MTSVQACVLPPGSLLAKYEQGPGYTDCYCSAVAGAVSQAEFVQAFYTTGLFKVERCILKWAAGRPSSDLDAQLLAAGKAAMFAAWRVEARDDDQLLLADFSGRTRSWLMVERSAAVTATATTRLYFGSAVVPRAGGSRARPRMDLVFHTLLGFHRLYSRLLLRAAASRLLRSR